MVGVSPSRWRAYLETVQYVVFLLALSVLGLAPISIVLGAGLVGVKIGLFLVGTAAFGYATVLAWPSDPEDLAETVEAETPSRFQRFVNRFPPVSLYPPTPKERLSDGVKLYVAAVSMYVTSYLMESVYGVVS